MQHSVHALLSCLQGRRGQQRCRWAAPLHSCSTCAGPLPAHLRRFGPLLQWQVAPPKLLTSGNLRYAIVSYRKLQDAQAAYEALDKQVGAADCCRLMQGSSTRSIACSLHWQAKQPIGCIAAQMRLTTSLTCMLQVVPSLSHQRLKLKYRST